MPLQNLLKHNRHNMRDKLEQGTERKGVCSKDQKQKETWKGP